MSSPAGMRIVVSGAGAVGSVAALTLARAGATVTLADPAAAGANASGVAAGMLAPGLETALDPLARDHLELLSRARDAWPALAAGVGAEVHRCGALWFAADEAEGLAAIERVPGAALIGAAEAEAVAPGLEAPGAAVHLPGDWRLDPAAMLAALRHAFVEAGGREVSATVSAWGEGRAELSTGEAIAADAMVVATGGPPRGFAALAELAALAPIKGQILRLPRSALEAGPIVRRGSTYVVPASGGAVVGATMEAGADDVGIDPAVIARLHAEAALLFPGLASERPAPAAGVRYGAPDGLPLVGASSIPGVFLALGARRNGWLLAPLIAEALLAAIAGTQDAEAAFRPGRFLSSARS
jgi:glycine oxidase